MDIQQKDDGHFGAFYISVNSDNGDGKIQAELLYRHTGPELITIDHTEVGPALEGQGVAKQLVMRAVDYARKNNFKILPLCPYANKLLHRTDEFTDVLAAS